MQNPKAKYFEKNARNGKYLMQQIVKVAKYEEKHNFKKIIRNMKY